MFPMVLNRPTRFVSPSSRRGYRARCRPRLELLEDRRLLAVTVVDIGVLPGGTYSHAYAINNAGQVVGYADAADGNPHAFIWQDGVMTDLGVLDGGTSSGAYDISSTGVVVGNSVGPRGTHAVVWENGVISDLGSLDPNGGRSSAWGINDAGQIVGASTLPGDPNEPHAVLYDHGSITEIPSQFGGDYSYAYDINNQGAIVGFAGDTAGNYRAFLYQDGVMTDIGTLGGDRGKAYRLNESGQIIGVASEGGRYDKSFLYSNGVMIGLGTLGGAFSYAYDVNESGQVVGYSYMSPPNIHAYVYQDGTMTDLNSLLPDQYWSQLTDARGINDHGQIVGYGYHNHQIHGYLLTLDDGTAIPGSSIVGAAALGQVVGNDVGATNAVSVSSSTSASIAAAPVEQVGASIAPLAGDITSAARVDHPVALTPPAADTFWSQLGEMDALTGAI
jgi:probable HAF family extracellular repeat protein